IPESPADARVRGARRADQAHADDALRDHGGARHDNAVRRRGRCKVGLRTHRRRARSPDERGSQWLRARPQRRRRRVSLPRCAPLGFSDKANLDDGHMWPTEFAVKELTAAEEKRIAALVKKAVS